MLLYNTCNHKILTEHIFHRKIALIRTLEFTFMVILNYLNNINIMNVPT